MRKRPAFTGEHAVGIFGALLILLIARLVGPADSVQRTRLGQIRGFLARRALDAVAIVGWTVDRVSGVPVERGRERRLREMGAG